MAKNKKRKNKPKADEVRLANIKKKSKSGISAVRTNLFEVKINKQKHSILNKKKKHHFGLPGVSRSAAIKKREKTILADMAKEKNVSIVKDKRIGAGNSEMSLEEKMLQRMTMERKKRHNKKEMFNLNDDHEIQLTHLGQPLSSMNKFNDDDFSDDDDDTDGRKEADATDHFGGGFFTRKVEQNQGLTPLEDIIRKSKMEKMDRRISKDKQADMVASLDALFSANRLAHAKLISTKEDKEKAKEANRGDPFANNVHRMRMGRKTGAAPQRLKTDEEIEREQLAKKKEMEEERLRRMKGEKKEAKEKKDKKKTQSLDALCDDFAAEAAAADDDPFVLSFPYRAADEGDNDDDGMLVEDGEETGDDSDDEDGDMNDSELDGNLVLSDIEEDDDEEGEEEDLSGSGDYGIYEDESPSHQQRVAGAVDNADSDSAHDDDDDSEEEEDDFSDIDSGNEDSADLLSDLPLDDEEDDLSSAPRDPAALSAQPSRRKKSAAPKESLEFPESCAHFVEMLEASDMTADKLVSQLRKQFSPHLGEGNKENLGKLYEYLWVYCTELTGKSDFEWSQMDSLIGHLYDLCNLNPEVCCDTTRNYLQHSYKECFQRPENEQSVYSPSWPALKHLVQLKMVKNLFPTSDLRHPVASPALIYMTRMLQQCRINSLRDISAGLFVVTMCYEYVSFSKRLLPECLNFLACALATRLSTEALQKADVRKAISSRSFRSRTCKLLVPRNQQQQQQDDDEEEDKRINLIEVLQTRQNDKDDSESSDVLRRHLFALALKLLMEFVRIYQPSVCFDQLFAPHRVILTQLLASSSHHHSSDDDDDDDDDDALLKKACDVIKSSGGKPRAYMSFGRSKPAMLAMITPKFDEDVGDPFVKRSKKTDSAKRNTERLLHKKKSEERGAMREIRKDAKFIATHELKKQEEADEERRAKVKRIMGMFADQEGEFRSIKRQKYKLDV